MPVHQRTIYRSQAYGSRELWEDSPASNILADVRMSGVLGAVNQINFMSSYCFEIFDGLATLSDDIHGRVDAASKRTENLVRKIEDLEQRKVQKGNNAASVSGSQSRLRFLSKRDAYIPDVLAKATNSNAVKSSYNVCHAPPRLWKMDSVVNEDCAVYYSNPGFFFDEWLRVEQERQAMRKEEQKRERSARNQLKLERRKLRKARKKSIIIDDHQQELISGHLGSMQISELGPGSGQSRNNDIGSGEGTLDESGSQSGSDRESERDSSERDRVLDKGKKKKKEKKLDDSKKRKKGTEGKSKAGKRSSEHSSSSSTSSPESSIDTIKYPGNGEEKNNQPAISSAPRKGLFGLFGSPGDASPHRHTEFGLMTDEKKNKKKLGIFGMGGLSNNKKDMAYDSKNRVSSDDDESVLSARERAIKARARAAAKTKPQQKSNLLSEAKFMRDTNADEERVFSANKMGSLQTVTEEDGSVHSLTSAGGSSELGGSIGSAAKTARITTPEKESDAESVSSDASSPSSASSSTKSSELSSSTVSSTSSSSMPTSESSASTASTVSSSVSSDDSSGSEVRYSNSDQNRRKTNVFKGPSPPRRERKSEDGARPSRRKSPASLAPPPPPKRQGKGVPPPPPPPPVPARPRLGSALRTDISKAGIGMLKKTGGPKQRASVSNRNALLAGIRKGDVQLNKVRRPSELRPSEMPQKEQHAAISAILANRAKVAGSDSDESESDESEISF